MLARSSFGWVKPKNIKLVYVASPLACSIKEWEQRLVGFMIIYTSGAACLPVNCCFSEIALKIQLLKPVGLIQSRYQYHLIEMQLVLENSSLGVKQQSLTHFLFLRKVIEAVS